jgi:hypothetical protein
MAQAGSFFRTHNKTSMRFGFIPSLGAKNEEDTQHGCSSSILNQISFFHSLTMKVAGLLIRMDIYMGIEKAEMASSLHRILVMVTAKSVIIICIYSIHFRITRNVRKSTPYQLLILGVHKNVHKI